MKIISTLFFLLSFVLVFAIGLAWSFSEKDDALVFYNRQSHTKIAYIYRHQVHIVPGNSDVVILTKGKPIFMVPFYAEIQKFDSDIDLPSIVFLKDIRHYSPPVIFSNDQEKKEEKLTKKELALPDEVKK